MPIQTTRLCQLKLMEAKMSVLKTLNFVVATKRSNDPTILRRAKLLTQLGRVPPRGVAGR